MILSIDIGNSQILLALFRADGEIEHHWRCATVSERTEDDWFVLIKMLFESENYDFSKVEGVALASVVPAVTKIWMSLCRRMFAIEPLLIDGSLDVLPAMDVDFVEEVGGDRIANAVAVAALYSLPAIVIDFGTATTFDVVNGDGAYIGGVIAPGPLLSLEALVKGAARLSDIPMEFPPHVIGRNTTHAMQSGLLLGYLSLAEGMIKKINAEVDGTLYVVATGGLGGLFLGQTELIDDYHEHLTLHGIYTLYRLNEKSPL